MSYVKAKKKLLLTLISIKVFLLFILSIFSLTLGQARIEPIEALKAILSPLFGNEAIDPSIKTIVIEYRLPRIINAIITGSALSAAGVVMQALTRNPLADPYITGLASGASFGAAFALIYPFIPLYTAPFFAFLGGTMALILTFSLAKWAGGSSLSLILGGVVVGTLFSSLLIFLVTFASERTHGVFFWLFGSLSTSSWRVVNMIAPIVFFSIIYLCFRAKELNAILLGEEDALLLGISVKFLRFSLIVISSLAVAACVSFTGVIGFLGLVAPHLVRLWVSWDHRLLLPLAALTGSIILLAADNVVRSPINPLFELPIGAVTTLLGVPFFLYLMVKEGRRYAI